MYEDTRHVTIWHKVRSVFVKDDAEAIADSHLRNTDKSAPTTHPRFILDQEKEQNLSHLVRIRQIEKTKILALAGFEPGSIRSWDACYTPILSE